VVEHFVFGERRDTVEGIRILAYVVPGKDATVGHRVVRNERVEIEMREAGTVAVPLIGDAAGEILEDAKLEVDAGIEGAVRPSQQPSFPVRVALPNRGDVFVLWDVPARAVVVPALTDRDDLSQLAASDDVAHPLLIRATQPLRAHLHDLFACQYRVA